MNKRAVTLMLVALALTLRAAVPISPELQNAEEAGRMREINLRAEASLREKIEVGKQRYQEQQVYREALVQGITSMAEERRQEISDNGSKLVVEETGYKFDVNSLACLVIALGLVYQGVRFCRTHEVGDLSFGRHPQAEAIVSAGSAVDKSPEARWKDFVSVVQLPPMGDAQLKAHQRAGSLDSIKISLDITVKFCVDIAPALLPAISEERMKSHLEKLFEPYGIKHDDNSKVWLGLVIQGSPLGKTSTFNHSEKIVFFERDSILKKTLLGAPAPPEVLWGAQHLGYADQAEIEGDVFNVLQIFSEMFLRELLVSKSSEADAPAASTPQCSDAASALA